MGLFGGKMQPETMFQEKIEKSGLDSTQAEYKELIFGNLKKGDYQLQILVTDIKSGNEANRETTIFLVE